MRNTSPLILLSMCFMAALVIADLTSVKIVAYSILGIEFLIPAGTLAFALTYITTDAIGEAYGKKYSVSVIICGVILRFIILLYLIAVVGDSAGNAYPNNIFYSPDFWTIDKQKSYEFIFTSSFLIFIGGFFAILTASLMDVYVFHYLKEKHEGQNKFWIRNNVSTVLGQIVNSTTFVTIAFYNVMTFKMIVMTIAGQLVAKFILAFLDTPITYLARNYALGRKDFYKFWNRDFWSN